MKVHAYWVLMHDEEQCIIVTAGSSFAWLNRIPIETVVDVGLQYRYSNMVLFGSTWTYCTLPWLYTCFYLILLHSTMALLSSTGLYTWLYYTLPRLYLALLHSTWLYYTLATWLYLILLNSITLYHGCTWLYFILLNSITLHHGSTCFLLDPTWLYDTLPWFYSALHDSTTI